GPEGRRHFSTGVGAKIFQLADRIGFVPTGTFTAELDDVGREAADKPFDEIAQSVFDDLGRLLGDPEFGGPDFGVLVGGMDGDGPALTRLATEHDRAARGLSGVRPGWRVSTGTILTCG